MAVDSTPATTVKNMLNGIDYSALIGGPLQAAISAQAMAAKSSWEFIQQVGLNTNKDGQKSAVNVTFIYQKDGSYVKLIVPILTIVPIPMIVIDNICIQFKASLNASSSECSENSSSESIDAGGDAEGKVGWGPFSLSVKAKANYSSKKDSKATSESKYSVEYTQDVSVHAKQADMPAGLATVLNILSSSVTPNAGVDGKIELDKDFIAPTDKAPETVTVTVKNSNGMLVKNVPVKAEIKYKNEENPKGHINVTQGYLGIAVNVDEKDNDKDNDKANVTLADGTDTLTFQAKESFEAAIVTLSATIDSKEITKTIKVAPFTSDKDDSEKNDSSEDNSKRTKK